MKNAIKIILTLFILISCQQKPSELVILIGIDALSTDGLQSAKTPNLNRLIKDGALSLKARGVMPTVSAPNWGSMLTGAGPEQHGMTKNGWTTTNYSVEATIKDEDGYFPSIFSVIKNQKPELKTAMFYDWKELLDLYNEKYIDYEEYLTEYETVYNTSIEYMKDELPEFTFIYVGHVDEIGHEFQHGSEKYYQSIEEVDAKIGELLEFLDSENLYESTHIIIISDHGGVGYGHGGESMAEIQVPWIIKGPGIIKNKLIEEPVNTLNTACTIAYLSGLQQHDHWIGKPVFGAFLDNKESKINHRSYVPKPKSTVKSGIHDSSEILSFSVDEDRAEIKYTTDGSNPNENSQTYSVPVKLEESGTIKAISIFEGNVSEITEIKFMKVLNLKNAELITKPSSKYPAEFKGKSLIDGILGNDDYTHSAWMGYEVDDFEASIDLGSKQEIKKVTLSCLENENSWIFLPSKVEIFGSDNNRNFTKIGSIDSDGIKAPEKRNRVLIEKNFVGTNYRYIKIIAKNIKYCPKDHAAEGGKAWLFIDEVIIE